MDKLCIDTDEIRIESVDGGYIAYFRKRNTKIFQTDGKTYVGIGEALGAIISSIAFIGATS